MYKALIAFTALLGLFSFHLKAAPDDGSTCRAAAESSQQASPRFIGASSCSEYGSIFTGNDHCQVRAGPGSTCQQDQFGVWTGSNYYFTGCLAGGECGNQPGEPDPTNPDLSGQLNPLTFITPNSSTSSDPGQWVASQTSIELAKVFRLSSLNQIQLSKNDKVINDNLLALDTKLGNVDTGLQSDLSSIKSQLTAAKIQQETDTLDIKQTITDFNDDFSQASESISTDLSSLTDQVTESFTAQTQAQEKTQEDVTTVLSSMDGLYNNFSALLTDIQVEADRDYQNFSNVQNSFDNLTYRMIAYREQGYYEYNDLVSRITAISNNDPNQPCGISLGDPPCPPDDGGSGGLSPEDSAKLTTIADTSLEIASTVRSLDRTADDIDSSVGDVEDAVEDVEDAVDSMRSALSDDLYYTTGQLGEKLDAINSTLQSGSGGGSIPDDLLDATNQELSELRQLVAANHTASQAQLQNLNTTASGQSEQLASLSTSVSGIGESLDSIKSGLSGSAYESPGMSDTDIKDSLGVGDIVGREDLFTDDIELDSFTGSYTGWLSTSTCPDIPPFELPFDIQWKLDLKLFCDVLGIFGVFVMASAYFSVPFIVFGGKK